MVFACNTICDRFMKQIEMLSYSYRLYNNLYNKRVVKSISNNNGITKENYWECSRCVIYIKKELAFVSPVNGRLMCPCCGTSLRKRKRSLNSDTRIVKGRY